MKWELIAVIITIATLSGVYMLHLVGPEVLADVLVGKSGEYILGIGRGVSMMPAIEPGDVVIIDRNPENIEIGDIIVYRYQDKLIGHRVIAIVEEGVIAKGDNNPYPDNLVPWDKIVGKIVWEVEDPSPLDMWVLSKIFEGIGG